MKVSEEQLLFWKKAMFPEIAEKDKEIKRQKEVINGMIENEEKYLLEINKLKSIIKEVREYIDRRDLEWGSEEHNHVLEILDKAGDEK